MYGECGFTGKKYFKHGGSQNATLRPINIPGEVEGLRSAATSRSLGNRGYTATEHISIATQQRETREHRVI